MAESLCEKHLCLDLVLFSSFIQGGTEYKALLSFQRPNVMTVFWLWSSCAALTQQPELQQWSARCKKVWDTKGLKLEELSVFYAGQIEG